MLINVDAKALEWFAAVFLSQDKVGIEECWDATIDMHSDNQRRISLPSRLIAKVFLFRLIFGGTAYAYSTDSDFQEVGWNARQWQKAIDSFYDKYQGLNKWHQAIVAEVISSPLHQLVMPTGRIYTYERYSKQGEWIWPRTTILNYPVQGLGADLMTIGRYLLMSLIIPHKKVLLLSTVHDSILIDCPKEDVDKVIEIVYNVWNDIPAEFERQFGVKFNVPMRCEIQVGPNWGDMEKIDAN